MMAEVPSASDPREEVVMRAVNDIVFRQQLLADPKPTLEKALGIALPPALEVRVLEDAPNRICIALPMPATADAELADEELAAAAGGYRAESLPRLGAMPEPMPSPGVNPDPIPPPVRTLSALYLRRRR